MSTNDTGSNNPYRVPGDGEGEPNKDPYGQQPPSGQPPAYGQQPPAYGQPQPPAYGQQQPPTYGASYGGGFPQNQGFGPPGGYPDNNLGGWSLGLALAAFFLCGIFTAIPAIIVGRKGLRAAAAGTANNPGMAMAGVVIGWIVTALSLLGVIFFVILLASGGFDDFSREFRQSFEQGMSDSQAIAPAVTPAAL